MNIKIVNSIIPYLETLYELNKNIIKLCGADIMRESSGYTKTVLDVIQDIPRLIPYENDNNIIKLYKRDGLLEYEDEIEYIRENYESILKNNYNSLDKIRVLRNKYQHKMHGLKEIAAGSGTMCLFEIVFKVKNNTKYEETEITVKELISIARGLNDLFALLQSEITAYLYQVNGNESALYDRLTRFNLKDFNKIYESEILREVGMIMMDF